MPVECLYAQGTPLNETVVNAETDFCNIQWPTSFSVDAGQTTQYLFGQIYEASVTEPVGAHPAISAQAGYGPGGSEPRQSGRVWVDAECIAQSDNNDEYYAAPTAPEIPGTLPYCFRLSFTGMVNSTYADLNGAGSSADLGFSVTHLG